MEGEIWALENLGISNKINMKIESVQTPDIYLVSAEDRVYMRDKEMWFVDTEEGWMLITDSEELEAQFRLISKQDNEAIKRG